MLIFGERIRKSEATKKWKPNAGAIAGLVLVISVSVSMWVVQVAQAAPKDVHSQFTETQLEGYCNEHGGVFFPSDTGTGAGVYACLLPDGTLIACGGAVKGCTATQSLPPTGPLGLIGLANINIIRNLQTLAGEVKSLKTLTQSILAGQNNLTTQVGGLDFACAAPDLVPIPIGSAGFNRCEGEANLNISVYNQSGGDAAASVTQVFFRVAGSTTCGTDCAQVNVPTPALSAFSGTNLVVPIPTGCFDIDAICQFKISVDGTNVVAESGEVNNNAAGQCVRVIQ